MSTTDIKVRIGLDGAPQVQAGATAAATALSGLGDKVQRFGTTTKATGQQTAQLSAQLQDFFVQVQAGGSPLTAFIQQGSQLSAVFGGFGNAARAVASLITPTVAAIGAAAAAIGTVGYAYVAAQREQEAFRRSIVLTGNAAGVTAGQLQQLARSASVGSVGTNADVLAQLVSTGQVAGSVLAQATEAAVRLDREGGAAIKETVAAFADLGKAPLDALVRLNDAQNFLTLATYRQVAALVEQGKAAEAARVAQEAYAASGIERSKELAAQLGFLDRAWRSITGAINDAAKALRSIGAPDTLEDQLAKAQASLAALDAAGRRSQDPVRDQQRRAAIQQNIDALQLQIYTERELAQATADRAEATRKGITAEKEAADEAKRAAKERETALKRAREEAERLAAAMVKAGNGLIEAATLENAGLNADFLQKWEQLNAALRANPALNEQVRATQARLIEQQPFMRKALEDRLRAEREAAKAQADYLSSLDKSIDGNDRELQALRDQYIEVTAGAAARQDLVQARLEDAAAQAQQALASAELVGANDAELERLGRIAEQLRAVADLRRGITNATQAKEVADASAEASRKATAEWERAADSIRDSLTDAFRRAFESGEDFGTAMAKVIENELKARVATALSGALADGVLSLIGLQQGAGAAGAAGGVNGYAQAAQTASTLFGYGKSAYGYFSGATAAAAANTVPATTAAQAAFLEANGVTASTATLGSSGAASSGVALSTWAAAIAAGIYKANQDYSQGFNAGGARQVGRETFGASGTFEALQNDLLKSLGVGDRLASLLSGATAVAKILGRAAPRAEAAGFQGSIAGGDFTGQGFVDIVEKGGLLRSDKRSTQTSALSEELGRFLDDAARGVFDKATEFGQALGLPVEALASLTQDIKVKLTDDAEANAKAINEALAGYGDALVAGYADVVKPLAQYGETTVQTIERVGSAIVGVNEVLDALGVTALQASIDGGQAALALQDIFGGLQGLQQAAGSYLQSYYTDAERSALATQTVGKALADFGLAVPPTREAFRALVDAQDLTAESGRQAFAALLGVAGVMDDVYRGFEDAATVAQDAADAAAEAAAELGDALAAAIADALPRFQLPSEQISAGYDQVAARLQSAGVLPGADLGAVLRSASKDDVFAFARAFVELGTNSDEAKLAVVEAAAALADLKDRADELAADNLRQRIQDITDAFGDLSVIDPQALNLSQQFVQNAQSIKTLEDGLASLLGTVGRSVQDVLADLLQSQRALQSVRASLADAIDDARLRGLTPEARVAALRGQESSLFGQLQTAADPAAVAQRLQAVILARIREEAGIRQAAADGAVQALQLQEDLARKARDAQIDALREQISGAERLAELSKSIGQFTASLQFGDLSPADFASQLGSARRLFDRTLTGARAGDEFARSNLIGNAQAYLQEAATFAPVGTEQYASIFRAVTSALDEFGATGANVDPQLAALNAQLEALQALNDQQANFTAAVIDTSADEVAALSALDEALAKREEAAQKAIAEQTDLAREQIEQIKLTNEELRAQIAQQAAMQAELLAELDRLLSGGTEGRLAGTMPAARAI